MLGHSSKNKDQLAYLLLFFKCVISRQEKCFDSSDCSIKSGCQSHRTDGFTTALQPVKHPNQNIRSFSFFPELSKWLGPLRRFYYILLQTPIYFKSQGIRGNNQYFPVEPFSKITAQLPTKLQCRDFEHISETESYRFATNHHRLSINRNHRVWSQCPVYYMVGNIIHALV